MPAGIHERTLETRDIAALERFHAEAFGPPMPARLIRIGVRADGPMQHGAGGRSLYVEGPEHNVVEAWDFWVDDQGSRCGVVALADQTGGHAAGPARPLDGRAP
jgi:hypothetical protein